MMSDIEEVIGNIGWGLYLHLIIAISMACAASQATAWSTASFALPMAFCDMILTENSLQNFGICLYFGIAFGSCTFCIFSDIIDRKTMISSSLLTCFIICLVAGFAHGSTMLEFCMFSLGSGLAANRIIVKIYLIEHLPMDKRGRYVALTEAIFSLTLIISGLIASVMIPPVKNQRSFDMRIITWRLMFGLSGASNIIIACVMALLRSSPRHLLFKRDYTEAINVLKYIYSINNSKHSQTFDIRPLELVNTINDYDLRFDPYAVTFSEQMFDLANRIYRSFALTFRKKFLLTTILLPLIRMSFPFEAIHVNLWLINMINHNRSIECIISPLNLMYYLEGSSDEENRCNIMLMVGGNYFAFIWLIGCSLSSHFLMYFFVDRLGRKPFLVSGCLLGCLSGIFLILLGRSSADCFWKEMALSSVYIIAYSIALSALDIVSLESYPTAIRSTAMIETQLLSKIFACICLFYLNIPCRIGLIVSATSMLGAAGLSLFLQELSNKPMVE